MNQRKNRLFPDYDCVPCLKLETKWKKYGYSLIAGVDEAGRGPLAGPVFASAVILPEEIPEDSLLWEVKDSKQLSPKKRLELFEVIVKEAKAVSVAEATVEEIDALNILNASLLAMERAILNLKLKPDFCLVDGTKPLEKINSLAVVRGDRLSLSIASASIVAKVKRDEKMLYYHRLYSHYNFAGNKGYATREHKRALLEYGPCPIHRRSFIKENLGVS